MQTPSGIAATAAVLSLSCGLLLSAQQQPGPDQPPAFRSGVELVTIDVGVVDKRGQPLSDLGPADFIVTVGGQPRRVVSAEFVDRSAAQRDGVFSPDVVPISTNEGGGVGRLFAFVVDQNTLEPGNARMVAAAASRFLDRLTFADRSALIRLPLGPNVEFTWAHDRVRDALRRVNGMGAPSLGWESGSLTEARDIANHNLMALRMVGERECRGSIFGSSASQGSAGGGAGPISPAPAPAPPSGGASPGGESGGSGTTPTGGGATGTGSRPTGGGAAGVLGGFGRDACMRDVQMQAEFAWRGVQMTSFASLTSLRDLLASLARVRGDKTVILISGGWPLDEREETTILAPIAAEAAAARVTFFTLFTPASLFTADRRVMTSTPSRDQFLHSSPLDTLASMTGGGSFRVDVDAQNAFDRLARELAGYYKIGVEKDPSDQSAKGRRMKVQVTRSAVTVRARDIFDVRTYEDRDWAARMSSALEAPVPATSVGLRVTSYITADTDDPSQLKLVLTGEATRLQRGEATFQVLVRDLQGKRILAGEQSLGDVTGDSLPFSTNIPVSPGSYIVRIAVMDSAGRVGSVDHRTDARRVPLGSLSAAGPLLVRVPIGGDGEPRFALDGVRQDERLALEVGLEGESGPVAGANVAFEIAATAEGPALVHRAGVLSRGPRDGSVVAQAVADMRVLPPGQYVARAKVTSAGQAMGEVRRTFEVMGAPRVLTEVTSGSSAIVSRAKPAPLAARALGAVRPFSIDQVLAPAVLGAFLDRVAARPDASAPAMRELLENARSAPLGELAVSDGLAAEAPVAAFLKGLSLLAQRKLDPAADAFRSAMRASSDFYPAMVYLAACYAAGGNDKEAAAAWRTSLIKEGDALAPHLLLADALLRQGRGDLALQDLESARRRWPHDDALQRRFVVAALLAGKYKDGLQAVDDLIQQDKEDEPSLALALLVLYESFVNGRPVESAEQDRARMTRFADAYRAAGGPSLALVDVWLAAARKH
jgi:VWFA-related protein